MGCSHSSSALCCHELPNVRTGTVHLPVNPSYCSLPSPQSLSSGHQQQSFGYIGELHMLSPSGCGVPRQQFLLLSPDLPCWV